MAMGANKVETKSRHLVHMTSEVDLEVDMEVLPAEPRRSCGELFFSQLSVPDTIQACKLTQREDLFTWTPYLNKLPYLYVLDISVYIQCIHHCTYPYSLYNTQTVFIPLNPSAADASIISNH